MLAVLASADRLEQITALAAVLVSFGITLRWVLGTLTSSLKDIVKNQTDLTSALKDAVVGSKERTGALAREHSSQIKALETLQGAILSLTQRMGEESKARERFEDQVINTQRELTQMIGLLKTSIDELVVHAKNNTYK